MSLKANNLLKELKERKKVQNLFFYAIGAIGLIASFYEITSVDKIRKLILVLCITGAPIVLIVSYFHGKKGRNPIPVKEILFVSICVISGGSLAVATLMAPKQMTILIRMMEPQEKWFLGNIVREFEQENP